jgi:hypothetical protein
MCRNAQKALNAQTEIGRRLRGCEKTLGTIASELDWHRNTLDSYFPANRDTQPTKLPLGALWDILECDALPDDLKALLLPDGVQVVSPSDALDHDDLAERARAFLERKDEAHHPDSPAGREISDCEEAELIALGAQLRAVA